MKRDIPGLKEDHTAAGKLRWRVRREGQPNKLITIPMGYGEPGFNDHYTAARKGEKLTLVEPKAPRSGTFRNLCDEYLAWLKEEVASGSMSLSTLTSRTTGLNQACAVKDHDKEPMGQMDADLPRAAFNHILKSFKGRTGAAETCLKAMKAAFKWGQAEEVKEFPIDSPVLRIASKHKPKGGAVAWSAEDVAQFLSHHLQGSMARLWFCLAYATRGRIGDAPTMGPKDSDWHDGVRFLEWQPAKKGSAFVSIPMDDLLSEELEHHENRDTYLVTERGNPFASVGALDNRIRKWIIEAGLFVIGENGKGDPEKKATRSQHGIRKGVAELMAESGATEYEIMSQFGWTEAKTAAIYTKKFNRRGAAIAASQKVAGRQGGPRPSDRGPQSD